jgi:hypothetical protein
MKKSQSITIASFLLFISVTTTAQNIASFSAVGNKQIVFSTTQNDVKLMFQTIDETNTQAFEIERSVNGGAFQTIKKVQAVGSIKKKTNYEVKFTKCYNTIVKVEYRIKVIFSDGSTSTSEKASFEKFIKQGLIGFGMLP